MEQANILVCEDEGVVANEIQSSLLEFGYNIAGWAVNAREAIQLAEKCKPDLALMDINLPGVLDGIAVGDILRNQFNVPIIYLTAYSDKETINQAMETQPLGYLLKPLHDTELLTTIESALRNFRQQRKIISKLEGEVQAARNVSVLDMVREFERDTALANRNNSYARILHNLAELIIGDLYIVSEQLTKLSDPSARTDKIESDARIGLIHQDYVINMMEVFRRIASGEMLPFKEYLVEDVLLEAANKFLKSSSHDLRFSSDFHPKPLYSCLNKESVIEALQYMFISDEPRQEQGVINIGTSLKFEGLPERYNPHAKEGWYVVINIRKYGRGIKQENLGKVFEPFFSDTETGFRSDIGMIIANDIAQRHSGWITIHSDGDLETKISVFLPES